MKTSKAPEGTLAVVNGQATITVSCRGFNGDTYVFRFEPDRIIKTQVLIAVSASSGYFSYAAAVALFREMKVLRQAYYRITES